MKSIYIKIDVPEGFAEILSMQSVLEQAIKDDRWAWFDEESLHKYLYEKSVHSQATEPAPSTHAWSGDPSVQDYASTQPAPSTAVEREAWLIEVKSLGPSWICSISRENGFTRDANKAIQFPTKESAEAVLAHLWKAGRNGTVFGLDSSCYSVTEHIFLGATPPSHDAGKLVESLDSIRRYGLDTLSGRTDGPDDRDWQRQAVNEMTKRATAALLSAPALPVGELTKPDLETVIDNFIEDYEMHGESEDGQDAYYVPNENDKALLKDAICGLLADTDWDNAWGAHIAALAAASTQPVREPLTDEELDLICEKALFCRISFQQFARSIESAHGIK